jgi:hypothetical protein
VVIAVAALAAVILCAVVAGRCPPLSAAVVSRGIVRLPVIDIFFRLSKLDTVNYGQASRTKQSRV